MIGTVWRTGVENGGYKPHLHVAVREGRMAGPGEVLLPLKINGASASILLAGWSDVASRAILPHVPRPGLRR